MKVKPIEYQGAQLVKFWCPGCGQFHFTEASNWNGDVDNPKIIGPGDNFIHAPASSRFCCYKISEGKITWSADSQHHYAGKTHPMPHEEAWDSIPKPPANG